MSQDHHQARAKPRSGKFHAADLRRSDNIAGDANYKEVTKTWQAANAHLKGIGVYRGDSIQVDGAVELVVRWQQMPVDATVLDTQDVAIDCTSNETKLLSD